MNTVTNMNQQSTLDDNNEKIQTLTRYTNDLQTRASSLESKTSALESGTSGLSGKNIRYFKMFQDMS